MLDAHALLEEWAMVSGRVDMQSKDGIRLDRWRIDTFIRAGIIVFIMLATGAGVFLEFRGDGRYRPSHEVAVARDERGWRVAALHPASHAYEAGLRVGDRLIEEHGQTSPTNGTTPDWLERPGSFIVERDGYLRWISISDESPSWLVRGIFVLVALLFIFVGTFTWFRAGVSRASQAFLLLGLSVGLTLFSIPPMLRGHGLALLMLQIGVLSALTSLPIFLSLFPSVRPLFGRRVGGAPEWLWLPATGMVAVNVAITYDYIDYATVRPAMYLWSLLMLGLAVSVIFRSWLEARRTANERIAKQVRIIYVGALLAFLPLILSLLPNLLLDHELFDSLLVIPITVIWPVAMAYAMLRYSVMDVDLVIRRGIVQLVCGLFFLVYLLVVQVLIEAIGDGVPGAIKLSMVSLAALVALPAINWIGRHLDQVIYGHGYDSRQTLATLARTLSTLSSTDEVIEAGLGMVHATLKPPMIILYERWQAEPAQPMAWLRRFEALSTGRQPDMLPSNHPSLVHSQAGFWQASTDTWSFNDESPALIVIGQASSGAQQEVSFQANTIWMLGLTARPSGIPYSHDDVLLLETLLQNLVIAISNVRRFDQLAESNQALHSSEQRYRTLSLVDPLTGLANRRMLYEHLERYLHDGDAHDANHALIFLDLDNFKIVNDSLGHAAGDQLLQLVGTILRNAVRGHDLVARLGGDEFAVLLTSFDGPTAAMKISRRIHDSLNVPANINGRELMVSASLGMVIWDDSSMSPDELIRQADIAMYHAKTSHGSISQYTPAMDSAIRERLNLELDLHHAIERHELRLEYQPIVSLLDGRMVGVEALLRWHHPTRGRVPPADFIPLAERSDLILKIGAWVLEEACRQGHQWLERYGDEAPIVSVNLSTRQLSQPDLVGQIHQQITAIGLPSHLLLLEITESLAMDRVASANVTIQDLRALGIHFAIDDFGTGYSSLSYLRNLRIEGLKLDRSFTKDIGDKRTRAIIQAMTMLGPELGMTVTAEGIETAEQFSVLRSLGCQTGQGYWLCRPVPPTEIDTLLATRYCWLTEPSEERPSAVA